MYAPDVAERRLAVVVLPMTRAVDRCADTLCAVVERAAVVCDAEVLDAVAREAPE